MGGNDVQLEALLTRVYTNSTAKAILRNPAKYNYFAGTMFWASLAALRPILALHLLPEDFESEQGQIDGTKAHALERLFGVVAQYEDGALYQVTDTGVEKSTHISSDQKYDYAP
jgi:lipopolysaccharide biosynthesis protein